MKRLIAATLFSGFLLLTTLLILSAQAQILILPIVTGITPNTGPADQQTAVTVAGQAFPTTSTAASVTTGMAINPGGTSTVYVAAQLSVLFRITKHRGRVSPPRQLRSR